MDFKLGVSVCDSDGKLIEVNELDDVYAAFDLFRSFLEQYPTSDVVLLRVMVR